MNNLTIKTDPRVVDKFAAYPPTIRPKLEFLRDLILGTATDIENIGPLKETLKWGEPSYVVKKGSTLRIDWKEKSPDYYAMYFQCTTKLIPTFQELYRDLFAYEGTRGIHFGLDDEIPTAELRECIRLTLTYHSIKHLPRLGR